MSGRRSALAALSAAEKGALLDELLTARPDLRRQARALAATRLATADRTAVADGVESVLRGLHIDELNSRAGYRPGRGYVHPSVAADEIIDEALQPFLDDLERRADLDMAQAATEIAVGILVGLYACRDPGAESLLEYSPDYAAQRAAAMVDRCEELGVELPDAELDDLVPAWAPTLR
jgi:hypothetical protein